jgi:nucleoside-diphosphate-sugar epimerase
MTESLFTGFPGFIASQLIRRSIAKGHSVSAIVLPSEMEKAQKEARKIQDETGSNSIRLVSGDITKNGLGLSEADTEHILRMENVIFWHLAAIYDLAVPRDIAWKVNVEGTGQVIEFLKAISGLERFMYFSTAYVAGKREGTIYENELIRPNQFKNFYEETKFEAEVLVDGMKEKVPLTILRPGIVRGHSKTGETIKFDGPYFFLNMIHRVRKLPLIPYLGNSASFINVVPIDYILDVGMYLSSLPEAAGKTLHLTDPKPHPVEEVYRKMVVEMTGKSPKSRLPHKAAEISLSVPAIRKFLGVEKETLDYLTWHASFDTATVQELLAGSGIQCADFLETMPAMVRFYEEHKKDKKFHVAIR